MNDQYYVPNQYTQTQQPATQQTQSYASPQQNVRRSGRGGWQHWVQTNKRWIYPAFVAVLVIFGGMWAADRYFAPQSLITVTGIGEQTVKPAKAIVSFSVVYESTDRALAITQGEERFNNIISQIQQYSVENVDKNAYQIIDNSQSVIGDSGLQRTNRFQYANAARITISDLNAVPDLIKSLYDSGATTVTQVRYLPEDEERVDNQIRELAVKDAKDKARRMARASGASLGPVVTIQEAASTGETGTPVNTFGSNNSSLNEIGEIELQSVVVVSYRLR